MAKARNKPGPKPIMTPAVVAKLEEAFGWGCTDIEACLWADIAPKTLYNYQEKFPEFVQRKGSLKETPVLLARKSVVSRLTRDARLSMDYLSRKKKDEFSQRNEHTGKDGEALVPVPILGGASVKGGDALPAHDSDTQAR